MSNLTAGPWRATAVRYAAILRAEMARTGMTRLQLAVAVGVSGAAVGQWRQAHYLPRPEYAALVADALCSEPLARLITAGRVIRCEMCGRERLRGQTRRRYCSQECRYRAHAEGVTRPLTGVQAAVDAFCMACEPEGVCRTPSCQLQPFGPLPLSRRAVG